VLPLLTLLRRGACGFPLLEAAATFGNWPLRRGWSLTLRGSLLLLLPPLALRLLHRALPSLSVEIAKKDHVRVRS
jgi:hypothetical protein